jgi:hypothetical protein
MKIRIIITESNFWYKVNQEFEVFDEGFYPEFYTCFPNLNSTQGVLIRKKDCKLI